MEDTEIVDRDAATAKLVTDAFRAFYEMQADHAKASASEIALAETRIMARFESAHKENKETAKENHECIEGLLEKQDKRISELENWQQEMENWRERMRGMSIVLGCACTVIGALSMWALNKFF